MRVTLLLLPLLFLLTLVSKASPIPEQWELEMDKDGIRVYTQLDEVSPYKQVKVTATINASMEKVMEILLSFGKYKSWMNQVEDSYLLNQKDAAYYVFILEDAAWPMQNRYHVSRLEVEQTMNESTVNFRAVPNYIEKRVDAIQIKQYEGYWNIEKRPDQRCNLEYVVIQHPGGHVPPWLANFHATENPYQSIQNLKEQAERESIRP
jgi:hypothetical protein